MTANTSLGDAGRNVGPQSSTQEQLVHDRVDQLLLGIPAEPRIDRDVPSNTSLAG